jgi:hypothetical protein
MRTLSGKKVNVCDFRENDVDIDDIVKGLRHKCRFDGQLPEFYSVLWHSVMVRQIIATICRRSPMIFCDRQRYWRLSAAALLHDCPEAYGPDYNSDFKSVVRIENGADLIEAREHERRIARVVFRKFGIEDCLDHPWLKIADRSACAWEMINICANRKPPADYPPPPTFRWRNELNFDQAERVFRNLLSLDLHAIEHQQLTGCEPYATRAVDQMDSWEWDWLDGQAAA